MALFSHFGWVDDLDGVDEIFIDVYVVIIFVRVNNDRTRSAPSTNLTDDIEMYEGPQDGRNQSPGEDFTNCSADASFEIEPGHDSLNQECDGTNDDCLFAIPGTAAALDDGEHDSYQSTDGDQDFKKGKDEESNSVAEAEILDDDVESVHERVKGTANQCTDTADEQGDTQHYQQDSCADADANQTDVGFDRLTFFGDLAVFVSLLSSIVPHEVVQSRDVLEMADDSIGDLLAAEPHDGENDEQQALQKGGQDGGIAKVHNERQDEGQDCPQDFQEFHVIPHFLSTQGGRGSTWLIIEHIRSAPATYIIIISKIT